MGEGAKSAGAAAPRSSDRCSKVEKMAEGGRGRTFHRNKTLVKSRAFYERAGQKTALGGDMFDDTSPPRQRRSSGGEMFGTRSWDIEMLALGCVRLLARSHAGFSVGKKCAIAERGANHETRHAARAVVRKINCEREHGFRSAAIARTKLSSTPAATGACARSARDHHGAALAAIFKELLHEVSCPRFDRLLAALGLAHQVAHSDIVFAP